MVRILTQSNTTSWSDHVLEVFPSYSPIEFYAAVCSLGCCFLCLVGALFNISFRRLGGAQFNIIILILTTLLQLKYDNGVDQSNSPFATDPITMLVAVSTSVVNCLAYIAVQLFPFRRFGVAAHLLVVLSSYASVASLTALLLSHAVRPYVYSIFVMMSYAEVVVALL